MKTTISLRLRLLLTFAGILLLALGAPTIYLHQQLNTAIGQEAQENALRDLRSVTRFLGQAPFSSLDEADASLRGLAADLGARITLIALDGVVLTDSGLSRQQTAQLENHRERQEVAQALTQEWGISLRYSDTLHQRLLYAARLFSGHGVVPRSIVRIAKPQSQIYAILDRLYGRMGWAYGGGIILAFVLVSLTSHQIGRAIARVAHAAANIGQGEAGGRIRVSPSVDFAPLVCAFNDMARRIETTIRTMTKQKMESEAVFNSMKAGVIVLDGAGRIVRGNDAAHEIFPELSHFAGRKPVELSLLQDLQDACDRVLAERTDKASTPASLPLTVGEGRYFDASIVPIKGGPDLGAIIVLHDISQRKQVEQIRRDFVANVSHELRTPLTSIRGYAETLLDLAQDETARTFLVVVVRKAGHMNALLDDLLQLSRLEHARQRMDVEPLSLLAVVQAAWKICQPLAETVSLTNELTRTTPAVMGNAEQLTQVFRNILENAVKYAPADKALIRIFAERAGHNLAVSIEDNGPGIPAEDQSRIFERFYRVEKDRNSETPGTGLGLAICRHIMMGHGGNISVQSPVPGNRTGTRFTITVPLAGQVDKENV